MISRLLSASIFAFALPAAAQSVPATNYTDMWYSATESGWGISFLQHGSPSNQAYAVWYTYDPRAVDASGQFKPLWIVMSGGTWTSPTTITGPVYVTNGVPFSQSGSNTVLDQVGTFTFNFATSSSGTFTYRIAAPAGLASDRPAFGLPSMADTKPITRFGF